MPPPDFGLTRASPPYHGNSYPIGPIPPDWRVKGGRMKTTPHGDDAVSVTAASAASSDPKAKALIVDWGGVLTSPLAAALDGWYAAEGIDAAGYEAAIRDFHDDGLA